MLDYKTFFEEKEPPSPLLRGVEMLCAMTRYHSDHSRHVKQAFLLGLWHESFPEYMLGDIDSTHLWEHSEFRPKNVGHYDDIYVNLQKFMFVSDTSTSWHQCYQDLRKLGWQRLAVHREGGRLKYLLKHHRVSMPEGYQDLHLILDISISTCRQVQVGTETKEVPIMKTVCEDLTLPEGEIKELRDGETIAVYEIPQELPPTPEQPPYGVSEPTPLVEADVSEAESDSEPRCEHGNLSGCCGKSDCSFFMGHDDPTPSEIRHYTATDESSAPEQFKDDIPF